MPAAERRFLAAEMVTGRRLVAELSSGALAELRERHIGAVLAPGDEGYDGARSVWNGTVDRRPGLILRCAGAPDVASALRFAREHDLLVSVRSGGHGVAGHAVCDGGVMIDLSGLDSVEVDPDRCLARVGGGATWGDFDNATGPFDLATTGGQISTTGVAGLTLGGGLGWLMRSHGATVDNLVSVDLITADGAELTASEANEPDLFWALRGGGGNFGIATGFEFRLHPVGQVLGGTIFWKADDAEQVMGLYHELTTQASDALSLMTYFVPRLKAPFIPADLAETPLVAIALCCIDESLWSPLTQRLRSFERPIADSLAPMRYTALQSMFDMTAPFGMKAYWRSCYVHSLSEEAMAVIRRFAADVSSPLSQILVTHLGGALASAPEAGTSFGHRGAAHVLEILAKWNDGPLDPHRRWADGFLEAMRPFSQGVYVNFLGDEGRARIAEAYEPESLRRLQELKARYDRDNFFCLNQNIVPRD